MNRLLSIFYIVLAAGLIGCSDSGDDSPTGSDGGGGGGTQPSLSIQQNVVAAEGQSASFTVTLSATLSDDVSFMADVEPLSASTGDYQAPTVPDTIPAGQSSVSVLIPLTDDATSESSEIFRVTITAPVNATIAQGETLARIMPSDGGSDVSFNSSVGPLLDTWCGACHISATNGGMNMNGGTAVGVRNASGNNGPIVIVGLASVSNLYLKTTTNPPFGDRMPRGGPYLTTAQQNLIRDWINQGAQDN